MIKRLAKINKGCLSIRERGILLFHIVVDYEEGMSQSIGNVSLDEWNPTYNTREGTSYGCEVIRKLLLCLNVDDFSEMAGRYIWVWGEGDGLSFNPKAIERLSTESGEKDYKYVDWSLEAYENRFEDDEDF